jgi:RND superfamily putative drug exporter
VTLGILLLAFGSLVAAGLPLMLTMVGLASAAGLLYLGTLVMPISIWAMNFALMFALALGIDYALFIVHRFRGALFGHKLSAVDATAVTMDTAGKAVLFSGITVLISLSAVMLVPSPAFRSMSLGIMLAVIFVLAATVTLLPAVLTRLGPRVDRLALPWAHAGEHRSPRFHRWGERLWRQPIRHGVVVLAILIGLAIPVTQLKTSMPSIKVVPATDGSRVGYNQVEAAFGPGATGPLQIVTPAAEGATAAQIAGRDSGVAALMPTQTSDGYALVTAIPKQDPSNPAVGRTIDRLRTELPPGSLVGGAVAENHDLQAALTAKTPLVIGVVMGLGFLLLLIALQAPLIAAAGVLTNLLATGAAFGVAKWVFQDGALHSLLGFQSQGFLDAWGPVFFFAMIFAISMDYTVFLLSSAKEHWDHTRDAREAMVGGVAHSGRVIFAAAAVMVAVFFTFALSGPLPPKEMGIILGVAVLLDAALIRLLLLPVLLRLMGPMAWYLPRWAHRFLPDVTFGHA